jgi:D-alanyl-D-alanine carboxypeptidase
MSRSLTINTSRQKTMLFVALSSKIQATQVLAAILFAVVLLITPLYRPPNVPNPEIPLKLHPVAPVPILKTRVAALSGTSFPTTTFAQAVESMPALPVLDFIDPPISAQALYLMDVNSMSVLYDRDADALVSPASTTKLMTALVALEQYSLDEVATVKSGAGLDGASAGLFYGEELTVKALLQATLIHSANDAAWTLAEHHPDGVAGFIALMNAKANELHLSNTVFRNPVGYDHPEHKSTAHDLALLTHAALQQEFIADTVAIEALSISDVSGRTSHRLATTNELLKVDPTIHGVKTGTTQQAGQVLITLADRNEHPVLLVLLGSQDRYSDTTAVLQWVYDSYAWVDSEQLRALRSAHDMR